jgi:hypothetical protein
LAGGVWWLSGRTALDDAGRLPLPGGPLGNLAHFVVFGVTALAAASALDAEGRPAGLGAAAGRRAFWLVAAYGLADEIHQHFTPGRTCSVYDLLLDAAGAAAALSFPCASRLFRGAPGRGSGWTRFALAAAFAAVVAVVTAESRPWPDRALSQALTATFGPR